MSETPESKVPDPAPEGLISLSRAAKLIGVGHHTLSDAACRGEVPYESVIISSREYRYVSLEQARQWAEDRRQHLQQYTERVRAARAAQRTDAEPHLYEIIQIVCGVEHLVFRTQSHRELAYTYTKLHMADQNLVRIKRDGQTLTISESDRLGYRLSMERRIRKERRNHEVCRV